MRVIALFESIQHLEDLDAAEFLRVLNNLGAFKIQEKLDGANLWLGVDDEGKVFTSREGKRASAERKYRAEDWTEISSFNQFRAATAAVLEKAEIIKSVLSNGDCIEIEVLFGSQPNAINYGKDGKSFLVILRGVNDTPDSKATALADKLQGETVNVSVPVVFSDDGENVKSKTEAVTFEFTKAGEMSNDKIVASVPKDLVQKFQSFLGEKSSIPEYTNLELSTLSLQTVPKEKREAVKAARAELQNTIQSEYKIKIKQELIDKAIRTIKSSLSSQEAENGIEGVVLRDQETGTQIKIVDKDGFSTINQFNQHWRGRIQSALNTTNPDADIEQRGGLIGELRIKIAELFGSRDLAKPSNMKKAMQKFKGKAPEQTIANYAASMAGVRDFQNVKAQALSLVTQATKDLADELKKFKAEKDTYSTTLKSGKKIFLSPENVDRTLAVFAEAKRSLISTYKKIKSTNTLAELLAVLYGGTAKTIHQQVSESIFESKKASYGEVDFSEFENKDFFHLMNSYLAISFLSIFIMQVHDTLGMRRLKDKAHYHLKTWSREMSPLNHWGYLIWRSSKKDLQKHVPRKTLDQIHDVTKHIRRPQWKFMHMDLSLNKDKELHLQDYSACLDRLIVLSGLKSSRLNTLLDGVIRWKELSYDDQIKLLNKLYMYALQFVPRSYFFVRLRAIQNNMVLNPPGAIMSESLLKQVTSIKEEDTAVSTSTSTDAATTSSAIATFAFRDSKEIVKRTRNPAVKRLAIKFPRNKKQ